MSDYLLGKAMADGFVKEPAVVTRKNFNPPGMTAEAIELMKLQDGIRLHEQSKVGLETYTRESGIVFPSCRHEPDREVCHPSSIELQ